MKFFIRHKKLRTKACIYFVSGFTLLWIMCNVFLYLEFITTLWDNFDTQMRNKATFIANSSSINPRLVPLPEETEIYLVVYTDNYGTADTIFIPPPDLFNRLFSERNVSVEVETEGGKFNIIYSMPSNKVNASILNITYLFAFAFILEIILAIFLGYWLSGKLIRPVKQVIKQADITDLQNNTQLLNEPETEDELRLLIASFNRMLARIKEQSDLQNAFFASASHELRTPLSIMQTRFQVLLSENHINDETKQVFTEQLAEVKRMIKMVNDFLLMSELQHGNVVTIKKKCDLSDIIPTIIVQHKQKAMERGLSFKISFTPVDESFSVMADEEKLFIILSNLIINSLKYSNENGTIDVLLKKSGDERVTVRISNKIRYGINPDIDNINQSFYHSKPLHSEGSGLGLWIASRLSEMNGFSLLVSISGNVFEVSLCM